MAALSAAPFAFNPLFMLGRSCRSDARVEPHVERVLQLRRNVIFLRGRGVHRLRAKKRQVPEVQHAAEEARLRGGAAARFAGAPGLVGCGADALGDGVVGTDDDADAVGVVGCDDWRDGRRIRGIALRGVVVSVVADAVLARPRQGRGPARRRLRLAVFVAVRVRLDTGGDRRRGSLRRLARGRRLVARCRGVVAGGDELRGRLRLSRRPGRR
mmetsp:Transcript_11627/g.38246  ORF Transcript_11627/g.38246 Transcript_11627/m.38246 type:complete len:213 (-) Transcript_11627:939-1577(-)